MSEIQISTVIEPTPEGIRIVERASAPALMRSRRRWRRLALGLLIGLVWGAPVVWTILVIRWDAARSAEVALARFDAESSRAEASCWRRLVRALRPPGGWIGLEARVRRCVADLAAAE